MITRRIVGYDENGDPMFESDWSLRRRVLGESGDDYVKSPCCGSLIAKGEWPEDAPAPIKYPVPRCVQCGKDVPPD